MKIKKFQYCDPAHQTDLQYCCIRNNKAFCQPCWFKQGHSYRCFSTKCGHFDKLAHTVIDKTLEIKVMQYVADMSSSFQVYENCYKQFFRFKQAITNKIKSDIQNKLPLFIWSGIVEMLSFKNPKFKQFGYEQVTCSDMLKIIKRKGQNKLGNLDEVVKSLQKMNHLYEGTQNRIKSKTFKGNQSEEVQQITVYCLSQASKLSQNLSVSLKNHMEIQISKILSQFDPSIKFEGVKFQKRQNFHNLQCLNINYLQNQIIPDQNSGVSLYANKPLSLQALSQCPQNLLQVAKSLLKQKIFTLHGNINQIKSLFPYKFAYLMCTTLDPDPQYQMTIMNLEKSIVKSFDKKSDNSFLNSINIIIMGPQLITIQLKNYPRKLAEISIYGYKENREKHYNEIFEGQIGIGKDKEEVKKINKFRFQSQLSPVELVLVQFELAYEHLFTEKENSGYFEGEKYVLARGMKLFTQICEGWQKQAIIKFEIQKREEKYLPLMI